MKGKWIWSSPQSEKDSYAEFLSVFRYGDGEAALEISADCEYAAYVNGNFVYAGQYADFPWYKVRDKIDITNFLHVGENELRVWAWHCGDENFCHYIAPAAVRFSVCGKKGVLAESSKETLSRKLPYFAGGLKKKITPQLGYSFHVDFSAAEEAFSPSFEVDGMPEKTYLRPIERLKILTAAKAEKTAAVGAVSVYDLGRETVGVPYVEFIAPRGEKITVSFGEWLTEEGRVPRAIGERDFSYELTGNGKPVRFFNPLRKLGCRYFEVSGRCEVKEIGLVPLEYPFAVKKRAFQDETRQKIYDTAVRTLRLNAYEHYFDCPWREQAFYALDGRFQMRYGYEAFYGARYQYAALKLMSEDKSPSDLISIVVPASCELVIPSFALYYIVAMSEYAEKTHDLRLIKKYFEKMASVLGRCAAQKKDGLLQNFQGRDFWNFYEWNAALDGSSRSYAEDSALNFTYLFALQHFIKICRKLRINTAEYEAEEAELKRKINEKYYDLRRGLYKTAENSEEYTELCNAYAVLTGAAVAENAEKICETLADKQNGLIKCTLSMSALKYDALLLYNRDKYGAYVLREIDENYEKMLAAGATSFWETLNGKDDFGGAGSLCHGWSALPVYYYALLNGNGKRS